MMVEVNEEIAREYFEEVCGYMVRTGFYFKKVGKKREGRTKGGAGPADIDLLILHPNPTSKRYKVFIEKFGKRAIVSVKGWHMQPKRCRSREKARDKIDDACESLFADSQASEVSK